MNCSRMIHESADGSARRADKAKSRAYWAAWPLYPQALQEAGVFVGGAGLQPPDTATVVKVRGGQRHVQDGPYAETKEQLGGFYIITAPDLDAALDWAARVPVGPGGLVEVRPNLGMG